MRAKKLRWVKSTGTGRDYVARNIRAAEAKRTDVGLDFSGEGKTMGSGSKNQRSPKNGEKPCGNSVVDG